MIVRAKIIEIVWDNYQGGSGKPVTRDLFVDVPNDTKIDMLESKVIDAVNQKGIKGTFNNGDGFQYDRLVKIEIVPTINAT